MWKVDLFLLELSRLSAVVARAGFAIRIRTVKSHDGIQETMMGMGRLLLGCSDDQIDSRTTVVRSL
jgi:hypothetical protein